MSRDSSPDRLAVLSTVELLLEAIRDGDRWSIARRTTGRLLQQLLADTGETAYPRLRDATLRGLPPNRSRPSTATSRWSWGPSTDPGTSRSRWLRH